MFYKQFTVLVIVILTTKKLHGLVEVVVVRQRDSVAKRHRTECETMLNPAQVPGAARSVG